MMRRSCLLLLGPLVSLTASGNVSTKPLSWTDADHMFNRYCYECHGGFSTDAGLDLVNIDQRADLHADPEKWTRILQSLRTHYMPHPDGREMPVEARERLIGKIRGELIAVASDYQPRSAKLRRLNRVEFSNTLNDLFFTDRNWAASLPADDAGYGFDNIAAALSISPLLMGRYFDLAGEVATEVVPQKVASSQWSLSAANFSGGHGNAARKWIFSSGARHAARHRVFFPGNGQYQLTFQLSADQAGGELARAEIYVDGRSLGEGEVSAGADDAPVPVTFSLRIGSPGEHEIEVRLVKDFYRETATGKEDRNLIFHSVAIEGPVQSPEDVTSPFLDYHFGALPEALSLRELRDGIHRFASRAYRRPVTTEEAGGLWQVFEQNRKRGDQDWAVRQGLAAVIDAVLTSPSFLFRWEGDSEGVPDDAYALASWLSYFLWSSMPDDRLFDLARRRQLRANLQSEVRRMLDDPKAIALADNFAGQWWRIRDLSIHRPDTSVYETADAPLLAAMGEETRRFFQYVLEADRPLLDFLTADFSFINERLARHYGIDGVQGAHFRKVSLEGTPRRGVWSQAGVLTVTSYPNHTSPVLRGQWVLENLIGLAPPPPPDNVPSLPGTEGKPDPDSLRESLALHREDSSCASCHNIMDPIGLALEHFDGVGGLRSVAERKRLSEETLFDGTVIRDPVDLARYFEEQRSEDFIRNVARKLAIYASGRGLEWRDDAALERIAAYTRAQDYRFSALIGGVVKEFAPLPESTSLSLADPTH